MTIVSLNENREEYDEKKRYYVLQLYLKRQPAPLFLSASLNLYYCPFEHFAASIANTIIKQINASFSYAISIVYVSVR